MLGASNEDNKPGSEEERTIREPDDDTSKKIVVAPPQHGGTLLPRPAAAIVSGVTGLGLFYVRGATKITGWGLYAGREATLKTLSVSRSALESILVAAGRDVSTRSNGDLGRAEAENLLERSVRSASKEGKRPS